jgi:hypothetical protein
MFFPLMMSGAVIEHKKAEGPNALDACFSEVLFRRTQKQLGVAKHVVYMDFVDSGDQRIEWVCASSIPSDA